MKSEGPHIVRRIFRYTFLLLNLAAIVWLALCAFAAVTSPLKVKYIALFSLTTPFAILTNVFFVCFWLFSSKKLRSLLSLIALAVCYKLVLTIFGFHFFAKQDMAPAANRMKLMSWNAHGMGIFNKTKDKAFDAALLDFIQQTDADILCLPEYSTPKTNVMKPFAEKIIRNSGYKDYRFKEDNTLGTKTFLGTAVFTKYPIRKYVIHKLSYYTRLLQADVELPGGQMVRFFFVHLTTFGLSDDDKAFIEEVKKNNKSLNDGQNTSRSFLAKFNNAYRKRAMEADMAAEVIAESPYPVVICGDFNDLPGSYTYTKFRGKLKDAFTEMGSGLGRTYNQILPTIRIDHVFYDPTVLKPVGFECNYTTLSDHNPVIVNFEIIPKAAQ